MSTTPQSIRFGVQAIAQAADVTEPGWMETLTCAVERLGPLDVLVLPIGAVSYDDDLGALVEGLITEVPETWSLDYLHVTSGSQTVPTATVRLRQARVKKGEEALRQDASIGDGPVDAALRAIDRLTGTQGKLMDYSLRAVSQGMDALGEVTANVDFGTGEPVTGRGASTDVIEASARAYLNAVNRHLGQQSSQRKNGRQP